MSTRTRIAITAASALALGAANYGQAMNIANFGLERDLWTWGLIGAFGIAIVAVFLVNRWWVLVLGAVPSAVAFYLYSFTDYSTPWDSEGLIFPSQPVFYAAVLLLLSGFYAVVLAIGLVLRWFWDAGRSVWFSRRDRAPSPRG